MLYVVDTRGNWVWRAMVLLDRSLTRVRAVSCRCRAVGEPDGMAVDQAGNLYVAHAGMGAVWKFSPRGGELPLRIASCMGNMTTNIAFGCKDNRDLYITESEERLRFDRPHGCPGTAHVFARRVTQTFIGNRHGRQYFRPAGRKTRGPRTDCGTGRGRLMKAP